MISIIGLLASLIAPAAMRARESARRMQCLSNLREMMRATTAHQTATTKFPIGKAVKTERGIENTSIHIQLLDFLDQSVVARALKPDAELHAFDSPPTSEANAQYLTHSIPVFICPSDSVPPGGNSYRGCYGTTPGYHYTQMTSPEGALPGAFSSFGGRLPQDIRDGLSHTVFFSEKLVGDQQSTRYDSLRDSFVCGGNLLLPSDALKVCRLPAGVEPEHASYGGATWLFGGFRYTLYNHIRTPNSPELDCTVAEKLDQGIATARSAHFGGVNLALGDGAARFVGNSVSADVWRGLATPSSKEALPAGW